tara:strand:+ start:780 stop:1058 length:279 start_codon:yes stop_codon:yes gene_type:complete
MTSQQFKILKQAILYFNVLIHSDDDGAMAIMWEVLGLGDRNELLDYVYGHDECERSKTRELYDKDRMIMEDMDLIIAKIRKCEKSFDGHMLI